MTDLVNFVMLIAASVGSMAFGILGAYGVLRAGFSLMRPKNEGMARERARTTRPDTSDALPQDGSVKAL